MAATRLSALAFAIVLLVAAAWWVTRAPTETDTATAARDERRAILPMGAPSDFFMPQAVGDAILEKSRPQISNVQVVCPSCGRPTRIGHRQDGDRKIRFCRKCETELS